jgi:hypothetical protein
MLAIAPYLPVQYSPKWLLNSGIFGEQSQPFVVKNPGLSGLMPNPLLSSLGLPAVKLE